MRIQTFMKLGGARDLRGRDRRREFPAAGRLTAQSAPATAAVDGEKGGWDITGPYTVVADWPKPLSNLPGHENWTWGAVQGIFAESPNRVFIFQRGELPKLTRPQAKAFPEIGPSLSFPVGQAPFRNASQGVGLEPARRGRPRPDPARIRPTRGADAWASTPAGNTSSSSSTRRATSWSSGPSDDTLFKRPHAVYISPYDAEKHVWVVDDHSHAIFKFTNDGKKLVQTIGTPGQSGADATHFNRPTFLAWLPDGSLFVADGYNGTRVAKFDRDGKFVLAWGEKGTPPETRPGYFNAVHGIAADPVRRRVYVSDRGNDRVQVFDENGKFIEQWPNRGPSNLQFLHIGEDRAVWGFDDTTCKVIKWDMDGRYLYSWGSLGDWPGAFFNMHGASVDQEGNLYIAEVGGGRAQKFRPRPGVNPTLLVSKPAYAAWR